MYLGYIKFTLRRCGTVFLILFVSSACIFNSSFIFCYLCIVTRKRKPATKQSSPVKKVSFSNRFLETLALNSNVNYFTIVE